MKYRNCQHYPHPLVTMVQVLVCGVRGTVNARKRKMSTWLYDSWIWANRLTFTGRGECVTSGAAMAMG